MVVCGGADHNLQADVIFVIESTAVNGAYINDLKTNYIIPALEYFGQGNLDENNYLSESLNSFYGIVLYQAADCLPRLCTDTIGPFTSPGKVVSAIDRLELYGGKGESHANIAEGLATALQCFEELQTKRDAAVNVQKHCLLICNSPPYLMPVMETQSYAGKTAEQLAAILLENNINLSIISPRKIPSLYKLFEKAGGDLSTSQSKNYAKDVRHLVLLKGFSLKERPISPPPGSVTPQQNQLSSATLPMTSLPSPLAGNDSPIQGGSQTTQNLLGANSNPVVQPGVGQTPVYRPPNAGLTSLPQHSQSLVPPGMVGIVNTRGPMMPGMVPNVITGNSGYNPHGQGINAQRPRWGMPPQAGPQRPYMATNPSNQQAQNSALLTQLNTPPSSMPSNSGYIQINSNSPLGQQQAQQQQQQHIKVGINIPNQMQNPMAPNQNPMQGVTSQVSQPNQVAVTSQAQNPGQPGQQQVGQMQSSRERHTIWQGLLEWIEKPKNAPEQQKITKHVPCQVSANSKDGEPELKADGWPGKLIMQLMPKQLIGNIGGAYLKNSKSVLFHPQPCEALESLTKVMSSGFAGCVHFTSIANPACDIKVLILLYTVEKRAYLGFIPNDQTAFVDRLRKVIQHQKSNQQVLRQTQGAGAAGLNPQTGSPLPMGGAPNPMIANPTTSQPAQGMMIQTNPIAMGGGQITQNVVSSSGQPVSFKGVLGQNVPGGGMQPRIGLSNIQQGMNSSPQPGSGNSMSPGLMGQRAACENQLQAERQHNLEKINQLKQTLEAAQQQEQQYKSQLERISHMKTTQLQEALQAAQQTEMHYKMLDQQRMANQVNQQAANTQQQNQQRMMRPVMSNNPGLRHLLQQQPQYRQQQIIGIQQQMGNSGPRPPQMGQQMPNPGSAQNTFDDVPNFDFM
ncbi:mediator of RNA polymerase II transcription subunit 25 [Harmonia axyridis]|uniref:mediator of RNA polymerase II transcription subunit 25 n=1 Tax=Harmonia axyridis TaxID=115357 RepID=UPI001E27833E|nr:mediator of RNA polymerase II transcription subunit 25 [Harmonia axyridis]